MNHAVTYVSGTSITRDASEAIPALIQHAGGSARYAYEEFFSGIDSPHTARAYRHAVHRFLRHCEQIGLPLHQITPRVVSEYLSSMNAEPRVKRHAAAERRPASKPTRKLHLTAIRHFFDKAVERHAVLLNPAASVRGPRHSVAEGKTPALDPKQAGALLRSIAVVRHDGSPDVVGLRDRAIIATLLFTAARVGAVAKLMCGNFYSDGRQCYFRLDEKGGKQRVIPARHDLQLFTEEYLVAARIGDASIGREDARPLFRSAVRRTGVLTEQGMAASDMLRMVKRRLRAAGLSPRFTCHSFRATTATNLLDQGVELADVQYLLGHADPRTTKLYDRRQLAVTRNIVERITI